jgi:prevent-host-death family protein
MVIRGDGAMREIKAGEFKAKCLKLLDEVAETGEGLIVTKRGRPVARVLPLIREPLLGALKGTVTIVDPDDDLSSAMDEDDLKAWEEGLERKVKALEAVMKKKPTR